ncbi:HAD family phosphatase [Candidatus Woesearchaeota archaeon]|nr:HAD family phosphatase [Candidatus Woesearchaeota archaeon]
MIQLIIFDFSGVCFSEEEEPYIRKFALEHNLNPEECYERFSVLVKKAEVDEISGKKVFQELLNHYHIKGDPTTMIKAMVAMKVMYPETFTIIKQLRQRYKTAYFTNYNRDFWEVIAQKFDVSPYFDYGIVSYQIQSRKPAKEGFEHILKHFGLQPQEAVFIDDSAKNLVNAREMGIITVHLPDRTKVKEKLMEVEVDCSYSKGH